MIYRDYQTNAINAALSAIESGTSGIIVAPTGSGKSVIMRGIIDRIAANVVVVCNEKSIRSQLRDRLGNVKIVTPTSFQPKNGVDNNTNTVILIDEVHHIRKGRAWGRLLSIPNATIVGFTATPVWSADLSLPILYRISYHRLREDGWMAPPLTGVVCTTWEEVEKEIEGREGIVTYISRKEDWKEEYGRLILADTDVADRDYREGETRLCNIATLTTGWDNKKVDTVILARRIGEAHTYLQIIGRLRHGGVVVDLSDNILRFGLDEDALSSTLGNKGVSTSSAIPITKRCLGCQRLMSPRQMECPYCGWHVPNPHISGKLWKRVEVEDLNGVIEALEKAMGYHRPCSFTNSGAWPVKVWGSSATTAYISMKTKEYWYEALGRLKKLKERLKERDEETLWRIEGTWWILHVSGDGRLMYAMDMSYGSNMVWQKI